MLHQEWPGNVRELENCIERAAVMSEDGCIDRGLMLLTGIEDQVTPQRGYKQRSTSLDLSGAAHKRMWSIRQS